MYFYMYMYNNMFTYVYFIICTQVTPMSGCVDATVWKVITDLGAAG